MNIHTTSFSCNLNLSKDDNNILFKLLNYDSGNIIVEIKVNDKRTIYHSVQLESWFERFVYFEILNELPLWSYRIYHDPVSLSAFSSRFLRVHIEISIDPYLIDTYFKMSSALNCLISSKFKNLARFQKFDGEKSYFPNTNIYEPPATFKVKLYDYQKKSLQKMINIEKNLVKFNIEYTIQLNFEDIQMINFDPIKNIKSDICRYLDIKTKGGILADEMGLGKTITTLSLITSNPSTTILKMGYSKNDEFWKIQSKATLIVCPSHITKQWEDEAKRSNPNLKILCVLTRRDHEKLFFKDIINADIIITSHQFLMNFKYYPCLHYKNITPSSFVAIHRSKALKEYFTTHIVSSENVDDEMFEIIRHHDLPLFEFFIFHRIVLDEGHEIFGEMLSNHALANYMSTWISTIDAKYYWYVSGSPFVNFTGLTNCIKYLNLNLHDPVLDLSLNSDSFLVPSAFNNIIYKEYLWNSILSQICIRHRKCDISNEIKLFGYNEKIEWVTFTDLEKNLYESKKNKINKEGLQQLCCHPLILDSCRKVFGYIEVDLSVMQNKLIEHHTKVIEDCTAKLAKLDTKNQAYHMLKKSFETTLIDSKYLLSILNKLNNTEIQEETDENCSICLDNITDGSITKCGHIFCSECIKSCLQYKSCCPMCKKQLVNGEIFLINKKPKADLIQLHPLIEKYGSKLGKLIIMVRNIVIEPESRIIIFSQWDFMLSLIGKTLSENGIANCFVKGNVWSRNSAINKFRNGKTLSGEDNKVIMLSLKNSASGTNLTEASHIFFVEPINACVDEVRAIEAQAIGRACRLGQKRKVELYRILVKDTIEEEIYNTVYNNKK
jgi:SNF2 family DNA or RNA helicase